MKAVSLRHAGQVRLTKIDRYFANNPLLFTPERLIRQVFPIPVSCNRSRLLFDLPLVSAAGRFIRVAKSKQPDRLRRIVPT